jgi:hypothetical protein
MEFSNAMSTSRLFAITARFRETGAAGGKIEPNAL